MPTSLLLGEHRIQYRNKPVLKFAVVVVRHDKISDTIHAASTEVCAIKRKVGQICLSETFNKVFLDAAGGGDEARDMSMLDEV